MDNRRTDTYPASFWHTENERIRCELCPQHCLIPRNGTGFCGARRNNGGQLSAMGYGRVSGLALDPIEKKPLAMFHPGSRILSLGGFGCNLRCPFCQNSDISIEYQGAWRDARVLTPEDVLSLARRSVPDGNIGAAYTYNEPLVGYEFVRDCAQLIKEAGLANVVVTNGFIDPEPLERLLPLIDAMNIDLKGFTEGFYRKLAGALEPVKRAIVMACEKCHMEVTTLIIPGENEEDIEELAGWLAAVDPEIPLHLSRFFPMYQYAGRQATPKETMMKAEDVARQYLRHVFLGNM